MSWFNKKTPIEELLDEKKVDIEEIEKVEEEKWVFVEGYKGLSADMTATHGDKMQYEIGTTYECPKENVKACSSGYHFSRTLTDAMLYYPPRAGVRYFKVLALVREVDLEAYGNYQEIPFAPYSDLRYLSSTKVTKLSSCKIQLLEEIAYDEIKEHINHPYIDSEERYRMTADELRIDIEKEYVSCLTARGYTQDFTSIIFESAFESVTTKEEYRGGLSSRVVSSSIRTNYNKLKEKQKRLEILAKNFESKDMLTLYLTKSF